MRSKTFCLLFCLTSCVIYSDAGGVFCSAPDATTRDCKDKDINLDDFTWKLQTAFNERKEAPKTEYVEIDMHRALYIEANAKNFGLTVNAKDKDQCKNVLKLVELNVPKVFILDFPNTPSQKVNLNPSEATIIAVFDPECVLYVERSKITDGPPERVDHIFSRNIQPIPIPEVVLKGSNKKRGLGNFIVSETHSVDERNLNGSTISPNLFFPYNKLKRMVTNKNDEKECFHECKYGRLFEFQLPVGLDFANTFKLKKSCKWMTIHLDLSEPERATEISLRHGFVRLPNELKAHPIEFETSGDLKTKTGEDDTYYEVLFTYFSEEKTAGSRQYVSKIIVANRHGRAVRTQETRTSTEKIQFAFSDDDCLTSVIGSENEVNPDDQTKNRMKDYEFNEILNLGYIVASKDEYKSTRWIVNDFKSESDPTKKEPSYQKKDAKDVFGTSKTINTYNNFFVPIEHEPETTTVEAPVNTGTAETVETEPPHEWSAEDQAEHDKHKEEEAKKNSELINIMYGAEHRYRTWAIPAGFATGSILSFAIANILMFVFRRSVLTFWFKAMYKRYGSDTTMGAGTTMGKTGAGETVGGSTTVGGGTTMGGTTAGETVGSTTAA